MKRRSLLAAGSAAAFGMTAPSAWAQARIAGDVRFLCGFPPGGTADLLCRILADAAQSDVGQTVSVGFQTTDRAKGKIVVEEAMGKVIRTRSDEQCTLVVVQFLEPLSRALNPRVVAKLEASFS